MTDIKNRFGASTPVGKACTKYRELVSDKNLCYEYCVPKMVGMTAEECVLLAVALDYEIGKRESPLLSDNIVEIGTLL